ncbi:MAG: GNAT family N-acetyltransferase [Pseudomonadota bacterium]
MKRDLNIRPGKAEDAAAIAAMANMLAAVVGDHPPGGGVMTAEIVARDLVDAPGLTLLVADIEGEAVGYALLTAAYETSHAARGVYLVDLAVAETAQRQGVGRALMRAAAREAVATGGRYINWVVAPGNDGAKVFYDGVGGIKEPIEARAIFGPAFEALLGEED